MTIPDIKETILIVSAVNEELELLLSKTLNLNSFYMSNIKFYSGIINQKKITYAVTGPGAINTAHALTIILEKIKPELIIQTGCAGAFEDSGITTGDVGIAECEIDCHTGIEPTDETQSVPTPLPFTLFSKNNIDYTNTFPTDENLSKTAFKILSENPGKDYKVVKAPFVTVSTITATDKRKESLLKAYQPCMESMEGSAAAHIALLYDIPFIEIRSASNAVGKRDKSKWDLSLAFKNANMAVLDILNNINKMNISG